MTWEIVQITRQEIAEAENALDLYQAKGLHLNDPNYIRLMCWDKDSDVFTYKVAHKDSIKLKDVRGPGKVEHG